MVMIKKAQATLEFAVVFVIMIMLLFGMLSLWKWSSDRIVKRQVEYNSTRLAVANDTLDPTIVPSIKVYNHMVISGP